MRNDTKTIKDFELQARSDKMTMDKLNRAYYGLTFDELVRAAISRKEDSNDTQTDSARAARD